MRPFIALALPLLALAGCATGPGLQSRMAAYIGAPEQKLVQSLGVPDKQISVNGVDYLAYVRAQSQIEPNMVFGGFGGPFWGGPYGGPYFDSGFYNAAVPQQIETWSCETTFSVVQGKVAGVSFKGNDCN